MTGFRFAVQLRFWPLTLEVEFRPDEKPDTSGAHTSDSFIPPYEYEGDLENNRMGFRSLTERNIA